MTNWAGLGALPFSAVPVSWSVPLSKDIKKNHRRNIVNRRRRNKIWVCIRNKSPESEK